MSLADLHGGNGFAQAEHAPEAAGAAPGFLPGFGDDVLVFLVAVGVW